MPVSTTPTTLVRINGQVPWRCFPARTGEWIAICDPLKLTLQAESWTELVEDMGLTMDAVLRELFSTNDFDRFMRENGWSVIGPIPQDAKAEDLRFDLPFVPLVTGPYDSSRVLHQ
jgi:hypothetical protein